MLVRRNDQRGDTLIEVLFAVTVFSLLLIGAMALMGRGTASAERSLETSVARQAIDAQAEALRYIHDSYIAVYEPTKTDYTGPAGQWYALMNSPVVDNAPASPFQVDGVVCPTSASKKRFIINPRAFVVNLNQAGGVHVAAESTVKVTGNTLGNTKAHGIWVEAVRASNSEVENRVGYTDFHIRACWSNRGSSVPATTGSIVRLYDIR